MLQKYKRFWDMPMIDTPSGEKHVPHVTGNIMYGLLGTVAKICFRYKVHGLENLRGFAGKSGVLIMGNHTSYLDPAFGYFAGRSEQWVRYMARDTLFEAGKGWVGWLFSSCGAFPVTRDSADRTSVKRAVKMLKNGEVVCILPEGTRRGKGTAEMSLHAGAALIARMADVPIVPMAAINIEKIKRKHQRIRFPQVHICFGKPMLLKDFDFLPKADRLEACTWYVMRAVFSMVQDIPEEQVDMKALFPTDRDFSEEFAKHEIPRYTPDELCG